jgi:hypothetical protein
MSAVAEVGFFFTVVLVVDVDRTPADDDVVVAV